MFHAPSHRTLRRIFLSALGLRAITTPVQSSSVPPTSSSLPEGNASEQTLAHNGEGLFPYYRTVALTNLGDGVLLASYDGRPDEGDAPSPNSILQRRSTDDGETWGKPTYVSKRQKGDEDAGVQKYGFSDPSYVTDHKTGKVFNFHVFSKDAGLSGSVLGNNDTDMDVLSAEVSVSTDGEGWSTDPDNRPDLPPVDSKEELGAPPLITRVVKPLGHTVDGVDNVGGVLGTFASSGEGIQIRYGAHAGRLVQQFAGRIIQPDGSTEMQAYSVYSDNGGKTWQMGKPVGKGMDENKVVELSNGNVMLNSRPSDDCGYRKVAISTDGGETYSTPNCETELPDPKNNGAITRMYPDAAEGSASTKVLLFTNANDKVRRANGTIRYSCDDGETWSGGRVFQPGEMSYSTVTALGDDKFGIFYEGPDGKLIFMKVDKKWIGVSC